MIDSSLLEDLIYETSAALEVQGVGPFYHLDNVWLIQVNESYPIEVSFIPEKQAIALSLPVAPLPENNQQRIMDTLLAYSGLGRDNGGFWLALSASTQWVEQMIELSVDNLDQDYLAAVILQIVDNAQIWKEAITQIGDEQQSDHAVQSVMGPGGIPPGVIRG